MSKVVKGVATAALIAGALTVGVMVAPAGVAAFLGSGAVWGVAGALATSAILSGVQAQLQSGKKPPRFPTNVNYAGTLERRRIIYGEMQVGGMETIEPLTTGTNNENLHEIITLAGHEVNAIPFVFFGQEAVGTISGIAGNANDGKVTSGTFANKAWVRRYLGTATQTADWILDNALSVWTSDHRGADVAYLAIQYAYDLAVYQNGAKPQPTALVQGWKLYDPRLDSTNGGSGAHRVNDRSTWAYSTNNALCTAHYLLVYRGVPAAQIPWDEVAEAADVCDESVVVPTGTQKRYTCNVVLEEATTPEEHLANLEILTGSMLGWCVERGGKWHIGAGCWRVPSFQINEPNVIGDCEVQTAFTFDERWNGIRGSFIDPAQQYQPNEFPPTQDDDYVTADGGSFFKDVRFDACTSVFEAQRAAVLLTRKSRRCRSITMRCDMSAYDICPGDTGIVTIGILGWANQAVVCEGWQFDEQGAINLSLRESNAADWNDPIGGDYVTPLAITAPAPVRFQPSPPSSLRVLSTPNGPKISWTAPVLMPVGAYFEVWEQGLGLPFTPGSALVATTSSTTITIPYTDTNQRDFWVRTVMAGGASPSAAAFAGTGSATSLFSVKLVTRGEMEIRGGALVRNGSTPNWGAGDAYSQDVFTGRVRVQFRLPSAGAAMAGLMVNPGSTAGAALNPYTTLNRSYLWFAHNHVPGQEYKTHDSNGTTYGDTLIGAGPVQPSDVFAVDYDGSKVRYYLNYVKVREVDAPANLSLQFFYTEYGAGGSLADLVMNAQTIIDTPALAPNSAADTSLVSVLSRTVTTAGMTFVIGATIPPPKAIAHRVQITVTFDVWSTAPAGTRSVLLDIYDVTLGVADPDYIWTERMIGAAASPGERITMVIDRVMGAAQTLEANVNVGVYPGSGTVEIRDAFMRIEHIFR